MSYWGGNFPEPSGGGGSGDTTPPTITIVSPASPGGFPADWTVARVTPIVLRITDVAPGIEYIAIVCTLPGGVEETVYRRGAFRGHFAAGSTITAIANGFELSVQHEFGWPPGNINFDFDALDGDGNLAP